MYSWSDFLAIMPKEDPVHTERGPKLNEPVCIGEEVKIGVHLALQRFRHDPEQKELSFPSSLSATERAYIHRLCGDLGSLKTWSRGTGQNRYVTISKIEDSTGASFKPSGFSLVNCTHQVSDFLVAHPVTAKESQELLPCSQKSEKGYKERSGPGFIQRSPLQIPPKAGDSDLLHFRQSLPVFKLKKEILEASENNQVILVAGETGSGKTTQVPQLILEKHWDKKQPCRILCTQPRRLAAISVSERIAAERGERIGNAVGYQIRLESKISPKTVLTFCTTGVLLRTFMSGTSCLENVTHIIVDEVHERDRFTDFLLLCLKKALPHYKNLRVILMSATLNMDLFSSYFNNCPIVCVPGNLFPVDEYFLEDVLRSTGYTNVVMKLSQTRKDEKNAQERNLAEWCSKQLITPPAAACSGTEDESDVIISDSAELGEEKEDLDPWVVTEMNKLMEEAWHSGNENLFPQMFHLISSEKVSVDYIHPNTGITPLMIASARGFPTVVEHLLSHGANINIRTGTDWTALAFAKNFNHTEVVDVLEAYSLSTLAQESLKMDELELVSAEDKKLLESYQKSFDDERVDIDLTVMLIHKIYTSNEPGAILVFLPGYEEITSTKGSIIGDSRFDPSRYVIYILHSSLQHSDQKRAFKVAPTGTRKIVLSTNIAETSITINDIVFVIDSGKVKEKSFDALTSLTTLKSNWISKANALQRKGRAGRCQPGLCYHLFSRPRYTHLQDYQTAEILRLPLQELCLHTKLLAPKPESISNFLSKCPESPPLLVIGNAVEVLKQIDALDLNEDMTELGRHLADLPIEPRLGKMILYSVVMKCLDPVLTIVCSLSFKDPFTLPTQPFQKRAVHAQRKKFAEDTFSDHMVLLRAFQAWQKAKVEGWERAFCDKHFISSATMEMLVGMRMQVMGQLKTSGFLRTRGPGDIRDLNTNSDNWALVKACLVAGTYPSIIQRTDNSELSSEKEPNVKFHYHSVLSQPASVTNIKSHKHWKSYVKSLPSKWIIYEEMSRMGRFSMAKCVTVISPVTVFLFAGPSRLSTTALKVPSASSVTESEYIDDELEEELESAKSYPCLQLDDWIKFQIENSEVALLSVQLRIKWHSLFLSRMRNPHQPWSQSDEALLQIIIMLLSQAEKKMSMNNPVNVGQRPRGIGTPDDYYRQSHLSGMFQQQPHHYQHPHHHNQQQFNAHHQLHHQQYPRPVSVSKIYNNNQHKHNVHMDPQRSQTNDQRRNGNNSHSGNGAQSPAGLAKSPAVSAKESKKQPTSAEAENSRFFVMKCNSQKNLDVSQAKSMWATSAVNEAKMNEAFHTGKNVYLIFSVQGSGHFQGFARMTSPISKDRSPEFNAPGLSGTFSVQWEKRANLPFQMTQQVLNSWNENRKVQVSRDGQEVEPKAGSTLIKMWERSPTQQQGSGKQQQRSPQSGWGHRGHRSHGRHNHRGHSGGKGNKDQHNTAAKDA